LNPRDVAGAVVPFTVPNEFIVAFFHGQVRSDHVGPVNIVPFRVRSRNWLASGI
jgi:hypothetical protein